MERRLESFKNLLQILLESVRQPNSRLRNIHFVDHDLVSPSGNKDLHQSGKLAFSIRKY